MPKKKAAKKQKPSPLTTGTAGIPPTEGTETIVGNPVRSVRDAVANATGKTQVRMLVEVIFAPYEDEDSMEGVERARDDINSFGQYLILSCEELAPDDKRRI